jgi:hypothetical protein
MSSGASILLLMVGAVLTFAVVGGDTVVEERHIRRDIP